MHSTSVLPNGLTVISSQLPHARSASIYMLVRAGSRYETHANRGVGHFLEHMLFKGTERYPTAERLSATIETVGGMLNAEAAKESMMLWAKVAARHLPLAVDLLADMLRRPLIEPAELEKERRVIVEELAATLDEASELVDLRVEEGLWGDQPLGWDVGGTPESVGAITRDDLVAFHRNYYSPPNTVVSVAGPQGHAEVVATVGRALGDWSGPAVAPWPGVALAGAPLRLAYEPRDTQQTYLCAGFRALSYLDPASYAVDLLNITLGEAMSSRLFTAVRERLGLAYDVQSYVNHLHDAGSLVVYSAVDPGNVRALVDAVVGEVRALRDGPTAAELELAREYWKGRLELRLEDTAAVAAWSGWQQLLTGEVKSPEEVTAIVESLTVTDVAEVARRCFHDDRMAVAIVGRVPRVATLERALTVETPPRRRRRTLPPPPPAVASA